MQMLLTAGPDSRRKLRFRLVCGPSERQRHPHPRPLSHRERGASQRRRAGKPDLRVQSLDVAFGRAAPSSAQSFRALGDRPTQNAIRAMSPQPNSQRQRLGQPCELCNAKLTAVRQAHGPEQRRGATGPSITTNNPTPSAYNLSCPDICITRAEARATRQKKECSIAAGY